MNLLGQTQQKWMRTPLYVAVSQALTRLHLVATNSQHLTKTHALGNTKTWSWSIEVERASSNPTGWAVLLGIRTAANNSNAFLIGFYQDKLRVQTYSVVYRETTATYLPEDGKFRVTVVMDTTVSSPSSDRLKVYIDDTEITSFSITNHPSLNENFAFNSEREHKIGAQQTNGLYFDGALNDAYLTDGIALTGSDFTSAYVGPFGTTGYHLPLSADANDISGNDNHWVGVNVTAGDYV
ncbi:MAG: hypothetical protein ACRBB6_04245 [Neptuniibacter sp.]